MRKLTRNFLVLSRLTSDFSRVFITNRKAEYFPDNFLCLSGPYCLAGCGHVAVSVSLCLCHDVCVCVELSEIITQIILANIICSRKWWRSCNQPGETPTPGCVLPARISRNNIVGVHSCQLQQAPAGTYVTFRGYITHL